MSEQLHCPKCGRESHGPYALLGHIFSDHWIVDDSELPDDYDRGETA